MKFAPKTRQNNIVIQEINKEILVYDLGLNRAFVLNETSSLIWQACDGKTNISEISQIISEKLETEIKEEFVWLALDGLKKENLLENTDKITAKFDGSSRREIIKRIGFTSMVAFPVITSIVAPAAIHAQSVTCGTSCQCSGLLTPVSVCPPGFAQCPQGCNICVVSPGGCFNSGDGVIACNGTCTNGQPANICPPSSPGDCTCRGSNVPIGNTCSTFDCPGGCSSCRVTNTCFPAPDTNVITCPGVCQ